MKIMLALIGVVAAWLVVSALTSPSAKSAPPPAVPTAVATAIPPVATAVPTAVPTEAPKPTATAAPTVRPYPTFVPSVPEKSQPAGPTGGKCADYASQAAAQAALRRDPVSAGRLDDDRDGIACESNPAPFDRAPVARP